MSEQERPLRHIQGFEAIEHVPNAERLTVRSTYALIREVAAKAPEQTAITLLAEGERSDRLEHISYSALLHGLHQTANLLTDLGVKPEDVIALLPTNQLETHLLLWGGQAAGIVCSIPPWLPIEQIIVVLRAARAKVLVAPGPDVSQELWLKAEAVRREVKDITRVLQVCGPGKERDAVYSYDALVEDYPADRLHTGREIVPDDIAIYFHTRDLRGAPAFVPLTHGNLLHVAWALGKALTVRPEEVLLCGLSRFIRGWSPVVGS